MTQSAGVAMAPAADFKGRLPRIAQFFPAGRPLGSGVSGESGNDPHSPACRHSTPATPPAKMARHGIIRHQGRRLRASARAAPFAARGGAGDRDAGQARRGRRHAGPRHHRHQQPVRRAGILGEARQNRHSADIGVQATIDFGDAPAASSRLSEQRMARAPIVLLAQSEAGYRHLMRLVSGLWLDPKRARSRLFRSTRSSAARGSSR